MKINDIWISADKDGYPFWVRVSGPGVELTLSWNEAKIIGQAIRDEGEMAELREKKVVKG